MEPTSNSLNSLKLKITIFVILVYYGEEQKERKQWANAEICETSLLVIIFWFFAWHSMVGWCSAENINCRDSAGRNSTPLHLAAGYNNLEVSKFKNV